MQLHPYFLIKNKNALGQKYKYWTHAVYGIFFHENVQALNSELFYLVKKIKLWGICVRNFERIIKLL